MAKFGYLASGVVAAMLATSVASAHTSPRLAARSQAPF